MLFSGCFSFSLNGSFGHKDGAFAGFRAKSVVLQAVVPCESHFLFSKRRKFNIINSTLEKVLK